MRHIPRNTRIFIGLSIITLLLTHLALTLSDMQNNSSIRYYSRGVHQPKNSNPKLDTSDWITYQDNVYPITFRHPTDWKIKTSAQNAGFYSIQMDVPDVDEDINIYISEDNYFGLEGLKEKSYSIDKTRGTMVTGGLIGAKTGEYYYTFDASLNPDQQKEFTTLVDSVRFN